MMTELQSIDINIEAVRSVSRAAYWSVEDAAFLPELVGCLADVLVGSIEGLGEAPHTLEPARQQRRRILDLMEAEEAVAACTTSLLHLLLIDPSPPTVLRSLLHSLEINHAQSQASEEFSPEGAVNTVMRIMQIFPSSDRVQEGCQHLLTPLLGS